MSQTSDREKKKPFIDIPMKGSITLSQAANH
jgi:hypothetical protein